MARENADCSVELYYYIVITIILLLELYYCFGGL